MRLFLLHLKTLVAFSLSSTDVEDFYVNAATLPETLPSYRRNKHGHEYSRGSKCVFIRKGVIEQIFEKKRKKRVRDG